MTENAEVNWTNIEPDPHAVRTLSAVLAKRHNVLPLRVIDNTLYLAMSDPSNIVAIDEAKLATGYDIQPVVVHSDYIAAEISNYYGALDKLVHNPKQLLNIEDPLLISGNAKDLSTADIVDSLFIQALQQRASDIHLEPAEGGGQVRFRIDGILHTQVYLDSGVFTAIVTSLKVNAGMDIAQCLIPQDGRLEYTFSDNKIDVRVASLPTIKGEKLVLRLLHRTSKIDSIDELGFTTQVKEHLFRFISRLSGMILVTGPTGCGKTTTLYAVLKLLNSTERNIITIEDPVEYHLPGINQVQVNPKAGLNFTNGLRAILRQDPNIIMVGEIRDHETAEIAVRSALTGHLVLSTLHTNDAASAITRLLDMGIEPYLLASALNGIMSQRLVRCVCPHCSEKYIPTAQEKILLNQHHITNTHLKKGRGCSLCRHTGYQERTAIAETLDATSDDIQQQILRQSAVGEIRQLATKKGMVPLLSNGLDKVAAGQTTIAEVMRAVGWLAEQEALY